MSEYTIPDETNIVTIYLQNVIKQNAPSLAKLHTHFHDINIDRVIQAFIDSVAIVPNNTSGPLDYAKYAGMMEMARHMKTFLSNLNNISIKVSETGYVDDDFDGLFSNTVLSKKDIELVKGKM